MNEIVEFHLRITTGPPYWWEIYRGDDPSWTERSMNGYLFESEALQEGRAALQRLQKRLGQSRDS